MSNRAERYVKLFIAAVYVFGWLGLSWPPTRSMFIIATPWTLMIGGVLLAIFHKQRSRYRPGIFAAVVVLSFLIEWWGVKSGLVFGEYRYGNALGLQIDHTPLIISVNWLLLTYMIYEIIQNWNLASWLKSLFGALVMVGYDLLLEPMAPVLDFWYWSGGQVPFQNYLVWCALSFVIFMMWEKTGLRYRNPIAGTLFLAQVLFFTMLNITF